MVKLFDACLTHAAVLGPGGFVKAARLALVLLLKHDPVVLESLDCFEVTLLVSVLVHSSWVDPTGQEVARVAAEHQERSTDLVVFSDVLIWNSAEAVLNVDVESAERTDEVDDLYHGVRLEANIACCRVNEVDGSFTTGLSAASSESFGQSLEQESLYLRQRTLSIGVDTDEEIEKGHCEQNDCKYFKHLD